MDHGGTQMADEAEVPGMRDAVEARRQELGLSPGQLAIAAGLTREGLRPVRNGQRKDYNDRTIFGVARALQWAPDWYERIVAGLEPTPLSAESQPAGTDERLRDLERRADRTERLIDEILHELRGDE